MSGHSKWSTIKHKKAQTDAKKGKEFSKLAKLITVSAREGGTDSEMNVNLRMAISKAKAVNMPSDNIARAIQKGEGGKEGQGFEKVSYEIYGPSGAALVVKGITDNKNRTTAEIKSILSKLGGRLGETGSVLWMFEKKGNIQVNLKDNKIEKDEIELIGIEAGVDDIKSTDESIEFVCQPERISKIERAFLAFGVKSQFSEIKLVPTDLVDFSDLEKEKILELSESLKDQEDIEEVFLNVKM